MESDELFDYISDLPNDNVLEICNFVLIGGGGGGEAGVGGVGCGEVQGGGQADHREPVTGDSYDINTFQENNFVEVMDFRSENNNNNHIEESDKMKVIF